MRIFRTVVVGVAVGFTWIGCVAQFGNNDRVQGSPRIDATADIDAAARDTARDTLP